MPVLKRVSPEQQISELREQLAEARETIRQLQEQLGSTTTRKFYDGISLTRREGVVLNMLMTADSLCSRERLLIGLYGPDAAADHNLNNISVAVCFLRKKLKPHGVEIPPIVYGEGYVMSKESKERLRSLEVSADRHTVKGTRSAQMQQTEAPSQRTPGGGRSWSARLFAPQVA
jgi:hypothetical protein